MQRGERECKREQMQMERLEPNPSKKPKALMPCQIINFSKSLSCQEHNVCQAIQRQKCKLKTRKHKRLSQYVYIMEAKILNIIMRTISPMSGKFEKYTIKHLHFELGHLQGSESRIPVTTPLHLQERRNSFKFLREASCTCD